MPSLIPNYLRSEPVSLVSSDTSAYDPPHRTSQEKPSRRSSSTTGTVLNGFTVDSSGASKKIDGVVFHGPKDANTSLQSLPNGRPSDSTDGWGRSHSRDGSDFSIANGVNGGVESGRRSPATTHTLSKRSATDESAVPAHTNGAAIMPQRPRSPDKGPLRHGQRGHTRAHSASAPQSPTTNSARPNAAEAFLPSSKASATSPAQTTTDNQIPPAGNVHSSESNAAGSSTTSLHPTAPRLVHRHTLQVPRLPPGRTSRDFSSPVKTSSESADIDAERTSPIRATRGSFSLGRRPTRSINSEVLLDDVPQTDDAVRWTETIKQKRASRRGKKREEEDDDRVVVGTKVDTSHVNWVTSYNMLTGIRFTVSRTNAKIDRELTDADFDARHKFSFDM